MRFVCGDVTGPHCFTQKRLRPFASALQSVAALATGIRAMEDAAHNAQEHIEATNGNAHDDGASSSSMPPSPSSGSTPPRRDNA
jgi:hypothetical protein